MPADNLGPGVVLELDFRRVERRNLADVAFVQELEVPVVELPDSLVVKPLGRCFHTLTHPSPLVCMCEILRASSPLTVRNASVRGRAATA
jgi:hypothetical protein